MNDKKAYLDMARQRLKQIDFECNSEHEVEQSMKNLAKEMNRRKRAREVERAYEHNQTLNKVYLQKDRQSFLPEKT